MTSSKSSLAGYVKPRAPPVFRFDNYAPKHLFFL